MIEELYQLFLKLSDTVDEDFHHPKLTLKPCGYGEFQLMEARVWEPDANCPTPTGQSSNAFRRSGSPSKRGSRPCGNWQGREIFYDT